MIIAQLIYLAIGQKPSNFKFEIQTRTIFEEAWGEIDHYIRYPNFEKHPELVRRMSILNNVLSGCVELVNSDYDFFIELNKDLLKEKENVLHHDNLLNDDNLIEENEVKRNDEKLDSEDLKVKGTNDFNSIDRIQELNDYHRILQSARPSMDLASYYTKKELLNTRFAEIYSTLPEKNRTALLNANLIKNFMPPDILSTFQNAYSVQRTALDSLRNSEVINSLANAKSSLQNSINNSGIENLLKTSVFTESMKAQKERDDLMKSVHSTYSEYDKSINSLYKLPNLSDNQDDD